MQTGTHKRGLRMEALKITVLGGHQFPYVFPLQSVRFGSLTSNIDETDNISKLWTDVIFLVLFLFTHFCDKPTTFGTFQGKV